MKSVLITGVCGGVGQALAALLSEEGWHVCGTDIVELPADLTVHEFWKGSIAHETFWRDELIPALSSGPPLQAFVHSAGVQLCKPLVDLTLDEWNATMAVNLTGAFLGVRYLSQLMRHGGGDIVNVASVHAIATSPGMAAYVTSKGGLVAFTRAAALELASQNIRVNAVLPGAVQTRMLEQGLQRDPAGMDSARARLVERTPLGRTAAPREIAKAISFLLDSEKSAFITGQTLVVDGGALASLSTE